MKKLPLILISIILMLFAFSACNNSTGTPEPSQEDIEAVKDGINVETIIKDAFSCKDGIDVKYEYPQAKASEEASIKAIVTFSGYTSGSLKITAGSLEFVFKGTLDGTSFSATTYSATTKTRLEVSTETGNPVPVSIAIPESANATAEVKATITDGVLSTTSVQVTINNLPESSTATITIADEEEATIPGTGTETGGSASGGGGGGTETPPVGETFEAPTPIFIAIDTNMTLMGIPAIIGFSSTETTTSNTLNTTIFGESITLDVSETAEGIFEYIYENLESNISIEIIYNTTSASFDFNQILVAKNINTGEATLDYYIITQGSDISCNDKGYWDGNINTYTLFGGTDISQNLPYAQLSPMKAIFHSDNRISGYATYETVKNSPIQIENAEYQKFTERMSLENIEGIINDLPSDPDNLGPMYQTVYYDRQENTIKTDSAVDTNVASRTKDKLLAITNAKQEIYGNWDLETLLPEDILIPQLIGAPLINDTSTIMMLAKAYASKVNPDEEPPADYIAMMYNMTIPSVYGFTSAIIANTYENSMFGNPIELRLEKSGSVITFTGEASSVALQISYNEESHKYGFMQVIKLSDPTYSQFNYYAVSVGENISYDIASSTSDGNISSYILIGPIDGIEGSPMITKEESLFHSDGKNSGFAMYKAKQIANAMSLDEYNSYLSDISIEKGKELITLANNDQEALTPAYQLIYHKADTGFGTDYNWLEKDTIVTAANEKLNWDISTLIQ